jgi:hypothetical protein
MKWLDPFWQKLNILRKKGKFNFKIAETRQTPVWILQSPKVRNSIHEKGSYRQYLAEPRQ